MPGGVSRSLETSGHHYTHMLSLGILDTIDTSYIIMWGCSGTSVHPLACHV